ncbi:phasin family protein [Agarilytica rhodophyticola]|uniref:phasin family protein n=1 Tax=Agarilytica rhodophyticola TaxID=1737490 RepID=UPI000B3467EB|nr:phasin family protein [Agarilytica rhodophyticola]
MYEKMLEQAESFFKPMSDFVQFNVETLDTIRVKQADLANGVLADSIEYAKGMSVPSLNLDSYVNAQKSYWQNIQSKINTNAQDNYQLLNDMQGKVDGLLKDVWNVYKTPSANDSSTKASTPKKAPTKENTPAQVKAKAPAKKKPVAKKAPKVAAAKTDAKAVDSSAVAKATSDAEK